MWSSFHLTRKPQTMRAWACLESVPLRPTRINGRLGGQWLKYAGF